MFLGKKFSSNFLYKILSPCNFLISLRFVRLLLFLRFPSLMIYYFIRIVDLSLDEVMHRRRASHFILAPVPHIIYLYTPVRAFKRVTWVK